MLDLYEGRRAGKLLHPGDFAICADEKPSLQARRRIQATLPPGAGVGQRLEHTYERRGALCSLVAWGVRRAKLLGRSEPRGGIDWHSTIEDILAAGDKVVTLWTERGRHEGEFQGIAPTGKRVEVTGIDILRIENGAIAEAWADGHAVHARPARRHPRLSREAVVRHLVAWRCQQLSPMRDIGSLVLYARRCRGRFAPPLASRWGNGRSGS